MKKWLNKFEDDITQLAENFSFNLTALFRAGTSYDIELVQSNDPEKGNDEGVGVIKVTVTFKEDEVKE